MVLTDGSVDSPPKVAFPELHCVQSRVQPSQEGLPGVAAQSKGTELWAVRRLDEICIWLLEKSRQEHGEASESWQQAVLFLGVPRRNRNNGKSQALPAFAYLFHHHTMAQSIDPTRLCSWKYKKSEPQNRGRTHWPRCACLRFPSSSLMEASNVFTPLFVLRRMEKLLYCVFGYSAETRPEPC